MLSSTLVSVLAPQWSSRQRRNARGVSGTDAGVVGAATCEPRPVTQDGTVLLNLRYPYRSHSLGQPTTQDQRVGERGWTLGRDCGRPHNSAVTPTSPSPQLLAPGVKSFAGRQGDHLSLQNSKPTTNSLLSRRMLNSNWRTDRDRDTSSTDVSSTVTNDKASDIIRAKLSFTSSSDGDGEKPKSLPHSAPPSYQTTSNDSDAATRRTHLFANSPSYIDSEGSSVTSRSQTFRAHPHLTFPGKQTLLYSSVERPPPSDRSDGTTVPIRACHPPSSPPSPYDRLEFLRSQSHPRGTTLHSTSRRKLDVQVDGGSNSSCPLSPTTANSYNNMSSLSLVSANDNKGPTGTKDNTIDHQSATHNRNYFHANLNSHTVTRKHTKMATLMRSDALDEPECNRSPRTQDAMNSKDRQAHVSSNINSPTRSNTVDSPMKTSRPECNARLPSSYTPYASRSVFSPNSPKTPGGIGTGNSSSSPSNTSFFSQLLKSNPISPTPPVGKTQTPEEVQWERIPASPKIHPIINTPTSFSSGQNSSSGRHSVQTSGTRISPSSHRPLHSSHPVDITRDIHNTPKNVPQIVKNQNPIASSTHAPTSPLRPPNTVNTPTSDTTVQSLTRYLTPTPYTRGPPPGEGRFTGQRPGRESLEPWHPEEAGSRWSPSRSRPSAADRSCPPSPSRPRRSAEGPAIFSSLRSGSATSPPTPPTPRTSRLLVWRGDSMHSLTGVSDTVGYTEAPAPSHASRQGSRFPFDHAGTDLAALGPQRKTAAPPSLPDFGSVYKPRFSSPPYASLKSSRPHTPPTQGPLSPPTSPQQYPCHDHHRTRSQGGLNVFALETSGGKKYSGPTCEDNVEVLVYRISKVDSSAVLDSIRPAQHCWPGHTQDTHVVSEIPCAPSQSSQHCQAIGSQSCTPYQSSNGGVAVADKTDVCKTESFPKSAVVPQQTQSQKKGFFSQRNKRDSVVGAAAASLPVTSATPSSEEPKLEGQKASNKMDQMLSRLIQTFRVKRLDDDKRKRTTTPALCDREPGDVQDATEGSSSRTQADEGSKERRRKDEQDSVWIGNKCASDTTKDEVRHQPTPLESFKYDDKAKNRGQPPTMDLPQIESNITEPRNQPSPSEFSPTRLQFEAYKEERIRRARSHAPQSGFSQNWDPSRSATLPGYRSSSAGSRNSSVFRFSQEDSDNDNVFLSPKLLQRRKTASLCEPWDWSSSTCADLKYGLEAGRSFSVSSVMSNRSLGPGRISTGPRVTSFSDLTGMSVDDLWAKGHRKTSVSDLPTDHQAKGDSQTTGSKSRSVSWSSEVIGLPPTTSSGRMLNIGCPETSHFMGTEGPPTPPPSPPWSHASRQTYRSLSSSSPSLSPSDRRTSPDSLSPRGHLPSRGYTSNLAAFKELDAGSDTDSDSTTDDEYYLAGDGGEKETEL